MAPGCAPPRPGMNASRLNSVVSAAVGAVAATSACALAIVPGVGSMPRPTANVAADVVAMVPSAFRSTALPGPPAGGVMKYPAGMVATVAVAVGAEETAWVV